MFIHIFSFVWGYFNLSPTYIAQVWVGQSPRHSMNFLIRVWQNCDVFQSCVKWECSSSRPPAISHSLEAVLGLALCNLTLIGMVWKSLDLSSSIQAAVQSLCLLTCLHSSSQLHIFQTPQSFLVWLGVFIFTWLLWSPCAHHCPMWRTVNCTPLLTPQSSALNHKIPENPHCVYFSLFSNFTVILNIVGSASVYPDLAPFPFPLSIGNH